MELQLDLNIRSTLMPLAIADHSPLPINLVPSRGHGRLAHCHRLSPLINKGTTSKTKGQAAKNSPGAQSAAVAGRLQNPLVPRRGRLSHCHRLSPLINRGTTSKTKGQAAKNSPGARKSSSHRGLCPVKCLMGSEWATVPVMTTFSEKFATQFWGMGVNARLPFCYFRSGGAVRRSVV
ncbi:hypothetical protein CEXT_221131 [Caerostris extrusa]|uniref:Uncharacterized protein n=1 Tax=Caerostris extrusa TaxID=172846 RepID=A0AAV4MEJ7_CAEEX|nr:hypothetical protein CEXT_221131 [Caerostris extrusa]